MDWEGTRLRNGLNELGIDIEQVNTVIPDGWGWVLDINNVVLVIRKDGVVTSPQIVELRMDGLPLLFLPPIWMIDGARGHDREELKNGVHQHVGRHGWPLHHHILRHGHLRHPCVHARIRDVVEGRPPL